MQLARPVLVSLVLACGGSGSSTTPVQAPPTPVEHATAPQPTPGTAHGRPQTVEQLADAALAFLRGPHAGDRFVHSLAPDGPELVRACPGSEGMLEAMDDSIRKRVIRCLGVLDWQQARIVRVTGGTPRGGRSCSSQIANLENIEIELDVGGTPHRLELDEPMRMPSGLAIGDGPRCE